MFRALPHSIATRLLRWHIQIRYLPNWIKFAAGITLLSVCTSPLWWHHAKSVPLSHDKSIWLDALLGTIELAIVPFGLAAYGGHLAAETITDPVRRRIVKRRFWVPCFAGVLLAFLQQYRATTEESKNSQKSDSALTHIVKMLDDLHGTGITTEADRRKKILEVLRQKYVLTHDVDQSMIDGTEVPPSDWVNDQLKQLGENWTVAPPSPPPFVPPQPRSYLAVDGVPLFSGSNPSGAEGSNFQVGNRLGFNVHYRATGPNAVYLGRSAMMTILKTDFQPVTLSDAYRQFQEQVAAEERKSPKGVPDEDWTLYTPGMTGFRTAYAVGGPKGHQTYHLVTQTDLDDMKTGAEIAVVIAFFDYKDGNHIHHLWHCSFLQPPAQAPGIWHYFDACPKSD